MRLVICCTVVAVMFLGLIGPADAAGPAGGKAPLATASYYGASEGTGDYFDPPGKLRRHPQSPVELIDRAGPVRLVNYAVNGQQLREMLRGGRLQFGMPSTGAQDTTAVKPLRDRLAADQAQLVIIATGTVDVVFTDRQLPEYLADVREAVTVVRAAGKRPVLRGFNRFVDNGLITPAMQKRLALFEKELRAEARRLGVRFLDVAKAGAPTLSPDGLHASFEYNQRIAAVIAPQLAAEAQSLRAAQ